MRHFSLKKRLSTLLLSAIIAVSAFAMPVSAAEVDTLSTSEKSSVTNAVLNVDGSIASVTRSSIDGYAHVTLSSSNPSFILWPNGSGVGGMGITVNTYSSSNAYCPLIMRGNDGSDPFSFYQNERDHTVCLNQRGQEFKDARIYTTNPAYYSVSLKSIPAGVSVDFEIWIYG